MKDDKELNAKTIKKLILPAFERINNLVLTLGFKPEWVLGPELHEIKFTGPEGEACEFSASAETRRKTPEDKKPFPAVVFNWSRGNCHSSNNVGEPAKNYTPALVLAGFKMVFVPWFR